MPINPELPPSTRQQITKTLGRHVEVTIFALGVALGATLAIVAVLVR